MIPSCCSIILFQTLWLVGICSVPVSQAWVFSPSPSSPITPQVTTESRRRRNQLTAQYRWRLSNSSATANTEKDVTNQDLQHQKPLTHQKSTNPTQKRTIGIVGAGAIAFGTTAILGNGGHDPMLWSPSGNGTIELRKSRLLSSTGALESTSSPRIAASCQELVEHNQVILVALPANGHKHVLETLANSVTTDHTIIISSHCSFGALYLSQLLFRKGFTTLPTIIAWGTTVCTARRPSPSKVRVNTIRTSVDVCVLPETSTTTGLQLCRDLFPTIQFQPRDGLLAIALSNINPQNHLGIALGNMSRMEKGEDWYQSLCITPAIGRLLESLDAERLKIADTLGIKVKTIFEHFSWSFHVPISDSISDMNQEIHTLGNDVFGPNTADSRYITEDVPFGLVPTIVLGELVGQPAHLHKAGVQLLSAMYGTDFAAGNDLLHALQLHRYTLEEIRLACQTGRLPEKRL